MPVVPALAEGAGQLEDLDEPPEPRVRGGSGRASLMKPLVVLALPGMYLFYKYSQYRREQRELSRRRVTERELQHLHHKIPMGGEELDFPIPPVVAVGRFCCCLHKEGGLICPFEIAQPSLISVHYVFIEFPQLERTLP
ncbi:hypothetical protein WN48_04858 [Eufriesea mexicana]|uniref:Uncharacterized protein n=1 Tax=Eufriesea mexicana TaxID=516756 RepID=A0A310SDD7_9HYME|nr:hypothetical protein WN48_04858 [Eufriesea mexicana]